MSDYIVRAMAADSQIRAFAITSRELVEQARQIHNTSPVATAALGRTLSAGAMMGASMKGEKDLLTIQIRGDGPLGGIVVTADSGANVKGYVHEPAVLLPANAKGKLDVAGAVGKGMLQVILKQQMQRYDKRTTAPAITASKNIITSSLISSIAVLPEQLRKQIIRLFSACMYFRIGNTVNISRHIHLTLLKAQFIHMQIRSLHHHHALFCLQQNLIQIKGKYVYHPGYQTCLPVIYDQFMIFLCRSLFHTITTFLNNHMKGCFFLLQIFEQVPRFFLFGRFLDVQHFYPDRLCPELNFYNVPDPDLDGCLRHISVHKDSPCIARFVSHSPSFDQAGNL